MKIKSSNRVGPAPDPAPAPAPADTSKAEVKSERSLLKFLGKYVRGINPYRLFKHAIDVLKKDKNTRKVDWITDNNRRGGELPSLDKGFKKVYPFKPMEGASGASGQVGLVVESNENNTVNKLWAAKVPHDESDGEVYETPFNEETLKQRFLDECEIMDKIGNKENIVKINKELGAMEYAGEAISGLIGNKDNILLYDDVMLYDGIDIANDSSGEGSSISEDSVVAPGQDRVEANNRISKKLINQVAEQLLKGLSDIHEEDVAHLDVKPDNVLISQSGKVTIVDFGVAQVLEEGETTTKKAGDKRYMPIEGIIKNSAKDNKVDIWGAGVTCFELLGYGRFVDRSLLLDAHGKKNYRSFVDGEELPSPERMQRYIERRVDSVCEKLKAENPRRYDNNEIDSLHDFLNKTIAYDREDRITAKEALAHPFIAGEKIKLVKSDESGTDKMRKGGYENVPSFEKKKDELGKDGIKTSGYDEIEDSGGDKHKKDELRKDDTDKMRKGGYENVPPFEKKKDELGKDGIKTSVYDEIEDIGGDEHKKDEYKKDPKKLRTTFKDGVTVDEQNTESKADRKHNKDLRKSRKNPGLSDIMSKASDDMFIYDFIQSRFEAKEDIEGMNLLKDCNSNEVLKILGDTRYFSSAEMTAMKRSKTDLEGSPYW